MAGSTDFNDLMIAEGLSAVRDQLRDALAANEGEESPAPSGDRARSRAPRGPGGSQMGDRAPSFTLTELLEHFFLIYGTDTVWDNLNGIQMRLSHLRHAVGRELYKFWEDSPERRVVYGLRFEPGEDLGPYWVNMWDGFALEPDPRGAEGCPRILRHLYRLCGQRDAEFNWLLNWIAYPLQYPGANMDTSVVMFGPEGPGKSAIWEKVIQPIYGQYGVTIGQAQLESQFTGWKSRKLFALAEEVVSRAEKSHYKGVLKQMVTGATVRVNEKNLPEREETNHINFVFLSNETVPLLLDQGDRRYMVLYADDVQDQEYFNALFREIHNGGPECLLHCLLNLDLSNFGTYTKPPYNKEKEGLVEMGMSTTLFFHKLWAQGDLDLPYCAARSADLFAVFRRWCDHNNEFKRRQRDFTGDLRRVMSQERKDIRWPYEASPYRTTRIWVPPGTAGNRDRSDYVEQLTRESREFRAAVKEHWPGVLPDDE